MPTVYRSAMHAYIDECRAANAYSSTAYPREYTTWDYQRPGDMSRRSTTYAYPVERSRDDDRYSRRSQRPRADSYRRAHAPPPPPPRKYSPPPLRRRSHRLSSNTNTTGSGSSGPPPRKSVRFTEAAIAQPSSSRRPPSTAFHRPKTYAQDAPPAAISESATDTARRLFHRRPSEGGRPSAAPTRTVQRVDSVRTLNSTKAEAGTRVGGNGSGRKTERDYRERERGGGRSRRR